MDEPQPPTPPRYYWDTPLQGHFDLEAVQAQIRTMTDEEVAAAVLAIRMGPKGHSGHGEAKSPEVKAREKGKRQTQAQLMAAAREYLLAQAAEQGGGSDPHEIGAALPHHDDPHEHVAYDYQEYNDVARRDFERDIYEREEE